MIPPANEKKILGNLIAVAYDRAAAVTSDPEIARELVAFAVTRWLRRTGQLHLLRQLELGEQSLAGVSAEVQPSLAA